MATYAERLLKQRMSNTGYCRTLPQSMTGLSASSVPPGEPPSDDSIDLTPDGLIVRRRRPVNASPSMGDLDIDLNIQAPITNQTRG